MNNLLTRPRPSWMPKYVPTAGDGCVLWLPGQDDAQSVTIRDRSGKGNNGTKSGATWTRLGTGLWVLNFDGLDDYVALGNPTNLQLQTFSLEAWISWTESVGVDIPDFIFAYGIGGYEWYIYRTGAVGDQRKMALGKGGFSEVLSTLTITDALWHHVAVVYDGVNAVFYEDTVADSRAYAAPTFYFTSNLGYGSTGAGPGPLKGKIALGRIYTGLLTATIVSSHFRNERHLFGV